MGFWVDEYATTLLDEVDYLKLKGVRYTWVKKDERGMSVYKYEKNNKLFQSLADYYLNVK